MADENSKIINADIRGCRDLIDYPINTNIFQCKIINLGANKRLFGFEKISGSIS